VKIILKDSNDNIDSWNKFGTKYLCCETDD
jgi:hypothetical protein